MRVLLTASALALVAGGAHAASISTLGNSTIYVDASDSGLGGSNPDFGESTFGTYGQTFTVDAESKLNSFGFKIDNQSDPFTAVGFNAYLYEWNDGLDDQEASLGDLVFDFGSSSTSATVGVSMATVDVTSELILGTGKYVILYESTSGGPAAWGVTHCMDNSGDCTNAYDGGELVYSSNFRNQQSLLANDSDGDDSNEFWTSRNLDSAFEIDLMNLINEAQVVPLVGAAPLLATGLAAFGFAGWRRRKS